MSSSLAPAQAAAPMSENLRGAGFMIVAVSSFTFGDTCMKLVAEQIPLYQAVFLRGILSILLLLVLARSMGGLQLHLLRGSWKALTVRSLGELGSTLTFFVALLHLPLAIISAIMQSAPLAMTAAAAMFMGEKVGWKRGLAVLVGFIGVLIIVRPGPEGLNGYALIALLSVGLVVLRDLATRKVDKRIPSVTVALSAAVVVTLVALCIQPPWDWQPVPLSVVPLICMAAALVISGYIFMVRVMRTGELSFTTPFRYTGLLWAIMISWLVWGFFPDWFTLLGAIIVVASGVFTLWREARLNKRAKRAAAGLAQRS